MNVYIKLMYIAAVYRPRLLSELIWKTCPNCVDCSVNTNTSCFGSAGQTSVYGGPFSIWLAGDLRLRSNWSLQILPVDAAPSARGPPTFTGSKMLFSCRLFKFNAVGQLLLFKPVTNATIHNSHCCLSFGSNDWCLNRLDLLDSNRRCFYPIKHPASLQGETSRPVSSAVCTVDGTNPVSWVNTVLCVLEKRMSVFRQHHSVLCCCWILRTLWNHHHPLWFVSNSWESKIQFKYFLEQ